MFCGQLLASEILPLSLHDKVREALRLMEEMELTHLPVVEEDKFVGLVNEEDLLDEDGDQPMEAIQEVFIRPTVKATDYFLVAVKVAHLFHLDIVPVMNESNELEGVITSDTLFRQLSNLIGSDEPGSLVVLEVDRKDFSVGEINRLVESNDAFMTQMNTVFEPTSQLVTVVIKINKEEISDIIATFQRHEYTVRYYLGEELFKNELQDNLDHLMNYLNM